MVYSRTTSHVVDGLPAWSISSHMRIVLKRGRLLVQGLFLSFLSKERIMAQKYSRIDGQFWSTCPKAPIKVISEYYDYGTCVFGHWKGFDGIEVVANLDAYQITKYQILQKFIFLCSLISEEFEKEFLNRGFSHILPRQAWSKSLFNFSKLYPSR